MNTDIDNIKIEIVLVSNLDVIVFKEYNIKPVYGKISKYSMGSLDVYMGDVYYEINNALTKITHDFVNLKTTVDSKDAHIVKLSGYVRKYKKDH